MILAIAIFLKSRNGNQLITALPATKRTMIITKMAIKKPGNAP